LQHVVFVWDLDEAMLPLHSLITGRYAQAAGGGLDTESAATLGRKLQALVLQLADAHMHFKEVSGAHQQGMTCWVRAWAGACLR
jgi:hypothetical protein